MSAPRYPQAWRYVDRRPVQYGQYRSTAMEPTGVHTPNKPNEEDFPCSRCRAAIGQPCTGRVQRAHAPRIDRMLEWNRLIQEHRCLCDDCWATYSLETRASILLFLHDPEAEQRREHHGATWGWTPKSERPATGCSLVGFEDWIAEQVRVHAVEELKAALL